MKKLFTLLFFVTANCFSQSYEYSIEGLNPKYTVNEIDSLNQKELFDKAVIWIKENYVNPDDVVNTTIENEKIRFTGGKKNVLCYRALGMTYCQDVRYSIELSFKDGRYKFEPVSFEQYYDGWRNIPLNDSESGFYKKGKLRKIFKDYPLAISDIFNSVQISLQAFLINRTSVKNEDW